MHSPESGKLEPAWRRCFWTALVVRLASAPLLLQWFHPDERQMLEFAAFQARARLHPFMESELHLRNQTLPWVFSWLIRALDAVGLTGSWAALAALQAVIGVAGWLGLWALVRYFREENPGSERAALRLAWFFALFWAFPLIYSRGLLEAVSFVPAALLLLSLRRRQGFRAGFWAGWAAVLRYPSALWAAGAVLAEAARDRARPRRELARALGLGALGLALAVGLGGLADWATYGSWLASAPAYWSFNRPHGPVEQVFGSDSLVVYWHWFEFVLTPWLAPLFLAASAIALAFERELLFFVLPYVLGHLWSSHREPRFMIPLLPFLALAIAQAAARGRFAWVARAWDRMPRPARTALLALAWTHVALNFAWYPLDLWAQWRSGQGELIRHSSEIARTPSRVVVLSDPVAVLGIDALYPANARWGDSNCAWHRPAPSDPDAAAAPVWVLAREAPPSCEAAEERPVALPPLPGQALARLLRVRVAGMWKCTQATLARLCPEGWREAPAGEPYVGRTL